MIYNDELYHFGKKGMKWGKRSNKTKVNSKKSVEDHIMTGAKITVKILHTLKAINSKNQNQKIADHLRNNGSGISAATVEFVNDRNYKNKVNKIWSE